MTDIPETFFISESGEWNADPIEPCMIEAVSGAEHHRVKAEMRATIATLTAERDRLSRICDELLAHCDKEGGECSRCGEIVCDRNEPLHFHHDGCPACGMDEPAQLKETTYEAL